MRGGTVPDGALFLTMTVVEREKSLEIDVWGHGKGSRAYAVDQWEIAGAVDDPYGGAWETLYQGIKAINGTWKNSNGIPLMVSIVGIAGNESAERSAERAERFAKRWAPLAYHVIEFAILVASRREKAGYPGSSGFKKYRIGRGGENVIEISGGFYRESLNGMASIPAGRTGAIEKPEGFSDRALLLHLALADVRLDFQAEEFEKNRLRTVLDQLERSAFGGRETEGGGRSMKEMSKLYELRKRWNEDKEKLEIEICEEGEKVSMFYNIQNDRFEMSKIYSKSLALKRIELSIYEAEELYKFFGRLYGGPAAAAEA
jgi:hypothetical protein